MFKKLKYIPYKLNAMALACMVVMAVVLVSCEKDDNPEPVSTMPEETPCEFTPPNNNGQLPPSIVDSMYFNRGLVNPNNPDEITFLNKRDSKVYRLNYKTGERNVVLEDAMGYIWPDWGTNDWLLFTRSQNLFKVKSNGDSLTQITFNGVGWRGVWSPNGNRYSYLKSNAGGGLMRVVADRNDVIVDTLPVTINSNIDWFSDSLIFWGRGHYVIGSDSLVIQLSEASLGVAGITVSDAFHLQQGLIKLNKETGETVQVHDPFPSCYTYIGLDYSPQKDKLLTSRLYQEVMPDGRTVYNRGEIVWLNLDGTVHEVIDIAQFMDE